MSVRFGAGGALRRDSNCDTYDSVTWAARARSRWPNPSSCNRCRMTNGTSTGLLPSRAVCLNISWSSHWNHNISDLTKVVKPDRFHAADTQCLVRSHFRRRQRVMATATKTKLKVFPLADRVAIRPMEDTEQMKGGLYIPDTAKEKPIQGEVIAVGPGRLEKGQRVPMELKVGDRVVYGKYTGSQVELEDEEIILIKESDVIAKLS